MAGLKKTSTVCNKCHHGTKKVRADVKLGDGNRNDYKYCSKK